MELTKILCLTLRVPSKIATFDTIFVCFYFLKKIRHDVSCESLLGRGFTRNIKSYVSKMKEKYS